MTDLHTLNPISLWPTLSVVAAATVTDLRSRRIPNWLVLPFLVLGLVVSGISGGWTGVGQSLLGVIAAVVVLGAFCWVGGMGMGDLKLCAAIGAWIGPSQLFAALVITAFAGGIMALGWAILGGLLNKPLGRAGLSGRNDPLSKSDGNSLNQFLAGRMPYAPAIAVGTVCSFLSGHV